MSRPGLPLQLGAIEPGYYRVRLVQRGPWVGARLEIHNGRISTWEDGVHVIDGIAADSVGDLFADAASEGAAFTHPLLRLLLFGVKIDQAEYDYLIGLAEWARTNAPDHPSAQPKRPIDLGSVPIVRIF
jgi:hypothetical protein